MIDAQSFVLNDRLVKLSRDDWWIKPLAGRMKCNIDVFFSQLQNSVSIDICIRDERGAFELVKT